jgi:putative ABC transport system permease protein
MSSFDDFLMRLLDDWRNVAGLAAGVLAIALVIIYGRFVRMLLKSLTRNKVRTTLTALAVMALVFVVSLIWSALALLDEVTREKTKDFKALVTERWQLPSQMPMSYAVDIADGAKGPVKPQDSMTWSFFGGTTDEKRTRESLVFFFCMDPAKLLREEVISPGIPKENQLQGRPWTTEDGRPARLLTMMDGLDELSDSQLRHVLKLVQLLQEDKRRVILGIDKLKALNRNVGDRITVDSINYKDIKLDDCEIIGTFPPGRYDQSAVMHIDRLLGALDAYKNDRVKNPSGQPHPLADKSLNLMALKVPDTEAYNQVAKQISESPLFLSPSVKVETWASGVASFLDAYRDFLFGLRWVLVPCLLATMALVIANAIGISVRERRTEIAVLKVLGFGPNAVLGLVLGEAILIGALSGFISAGSTWLLVNKIMGGIKFPIAFFQAFYIADAALWWGPLLGASMALLGSFTPAWSARSVKVSEVFAKIT